MTSPSSRHHKARTYAGSGLFQGLDSFSELERRIEALPTEQERGAAFEVFVEAYLVLDETMQASDVWVGGTVPPEVRRELNIPPMDYGYDGVFRTRAGELVAYQAKFRTNRTSLPYRELATFFGISEKANRRVLLTNSAGIAEVAESRSNFNATRGIDFDRLDADQLAQIAAWIKGAPSRPRVRKPRPHQRAALDGIAAELATQDRATVVMACGTGKTLVALWAAEEARPKRVLVLVPSLNLLRQTLHEWAKWTNWGARFRYLAVCSDPTVTRSEDTIELRPEDTDFPVRTDPAIVRRFLASGDDAVSVVFCTYQSAHVVGEAVKETEPFDLGIFDEAHKTTGREGTRYALALRDKNLPIRKRVFMTATPRHYNIRKRDKEGDFAVASMDDETIYGRVAYRLSFSEASHPKNRIIVPYKVVISVVDHEMIDNALLDQSEVNVEGDPIQAKWVAHQIALKRAIEEHDAKRIITFHSTVKSAGAFASDSSEGIDFHLPQFSRFHVHGKQRTADREGQMNAFADVPRGLITNARCLTEGVDVPSVDMVAFMNPRRSKVDIVQAVGRAMRTSNEGSKTCGYVLVPLFLELQQGETLTEALQRSNFAAIVEVLNAMRENDDELDDIIQELKVEKGKAGGFDESRLSEKLEVLGSQIQLDELTSSIRALLVAELGVTWDERYGQLIAYKEAHGHCEVPKRWKEKRLLGPWCLGQRQRYKKGQLSTARVARLEQLGFDWDPYATAWESMFGELGAYKEAHGHCHVPLGWKDNRPLASWCAKQRESYKKGELAEERVARLEQRGFDWNPLTTAWDSMFAALVAYKKAHGHCNVPQRREGNRQLVDWCMNQRQRHKKGKLSTGRAARLNKLGFELNPIDAAWQSMFTQLETYTAAYGHCNVPQVWKENRPLATWCREQRRSFNEGQLPNEYVLRLERLGFELDPFTTAWETKFAELVAYKKAHGHCNVQRRPKDNRPLATWCHHQRESYKKGQLSTERVARLKQLGFELNLLTSAWETKFAELVAYKAAHGHCDVPSNSEDNRQLATWCGGQRTTYNKGELSTERAARLEHLGFEWDLLTRAWETKFAELVVYKNAHGHCNVPTIWKDNPQLGIWCAKLRDGYKKGQLSTERVAPLKQLGFEWDPFTTSWETKFSKLVAYKAAHGNCNVPQGSKYDYQLANWCVVQRRNYRKGQISTERVARLERLGFEWNRFATAWETNFAELVTYKEVHGHCNVPERWKDNRPLATWCATQRTNYNRGQLTTARVARLSDIGFQFSLSK